MKKLTRDNIGKRAIVTNEECHFFKLGEEVVIKGIDAGQYYLCYRPDEPTYHQVLEPRQLALVQVIENRSRLILMKAEFKDGDGNKVTIKRSKCRHYYIKEATANQKRVSLEEIAAYLSDASCDLV